MTDLAVPRRSGELTEASAGALLSVARRALAEADTLPAIVGLADRAAVIRVAAQRAGLSRDAQNGTRQCVTCDTPEDAWDPTHPLYREGAAKCPLCADADRQADAERLAELHAADPPPDGEWHDVVTRRPFGWQGAA